MLTCLPGRWSPGTGGGPAGSVCLAAASRCPETSGHPGSCPDPARRGVLLNAAVMIRILT